MRPGEAPTLLLLGLNVFLLLTAYYLLKVAREPLILLGGGAEVKSYTAVGQSVLLVFVVSGYGWLASRVDRVKLITFVTLFFASNLVVFWALGVRGVPLGVPFFLWVGVFNIVTVSQFWSFAADLYNEDDGKRLFPVIGIGSSVGAVGGAALADPLIRVGSPFVLMLLAAGILASTLGLTFAVHRRELRRVGADVGKEHSTPIGGRNAFGLVVRDRYLLLIAALMLVLNIVTKTGDYVLDRMLVAQAPARAHALGIATAVYVGQFKAHFFEWINAIGVILQLFAVSRVIKYLGLRAAIVLVPLASLGAYGTAFVAPLIGVLFVGRVAESSLDYSLSNTARQALWLVTSREAKYKAKQVIDTFVVRLGDACSAAIVWFGSRTHMTTRQFVAVNVVVSATWVGVAVLVGREHARRSKSPKTRATSPPGTPGRWARARGAGAAA